MDVSNRKKARDDLVTFLSFALTCDLEVAPYNNVNTVQVGRYFSILNAYLCMIDFSK